MTAQVLFSIYFLEKDPHLNADENETRPQKEI